MNWDGLKPQIVEAAAQLRKKGFTFSAMYDHIGEQLGIPGQAIKSQFKLESSGSTRKDGTPGVKAKPRAQRRAHRANNTYNRNSERNANTRTRAENRRSRAKQALIKSRGMNADHINELWITKSTRQNSTPEEFKRVQKVYPMGDDPRNIQQLTQKDNITKHRQWKRLQKYLGEAERARPSARMGAGGGGEDLEVAPRSEQLGFRTIEPWMQPDRASWRK